MTTTIETYLNSLSEDILTHNIIGKGITTLPPLPKNLQTLFCYDNTISEIVDSK